jgi:hypothetical protein
MRAVAQAPTQWRRDRVVLYVMYLCCKMMIIYLMIPQIFIRTGGPVTVVTHEVGRNPKIES